jgi:hypothetical protein
MWLRPLSPQTQTYNGYGAHLIAAGHLPRHACHMNKHDWSWARYWAIRDERHHIQILWHLALRETLQR